LQNETIKFIINENKLFFTSKFKDLDSLKYLSIEEITNNDKKKKIIYNLLIDKKNKPNNNCYIEIIEKNLFFAFKLNKLYKYHIKMRNTIYNGYFMFINTKKPDDEESISINNISNEIIILNYEEMKVNYF
jgi:hypothetical protein